MPWTIAARGGIALPQIGWSLDGRFPVARSFVSHAHSDHIARHREILCSPGTRRLFQARMPGRRTEHVLAFGQGEQLTPDCTVTLHPAGHILGSAQCLLAHEAHGTLLYTGDFKLRPGLAAEACATPRADVLVMETTFGRPHYVFPPADAVLRQIAAFCHASLEDGTTPVLLSYSLGKSQELLCGLAGADLPVMLHAETLRLTRIYAELGVTFPPHREFNASEVAGHVVICPPQVAAAPFWRELGPRRTAVVSGWALDPGAMYRHQCDAAFPLSDHADFPDLLRFVEAVQPRQVFTVHGFAHDFARTLRERGIEAWALGEDNQLDLALAPSGRVPVSTSLPRARTDPADATPAPAERDPGSFFSLAALAEELSAAARKQEKIDLLGAYRAALRDDDVPRALVLLNATPDAAAQRLRLSWALARRAVLAVAGVSEAEYRRDFRRFGEAGEATAALLSGQSTTSTVSLVQAVQFLADLAAAREPTRRLDLLEAQLRSLSPTEAKHLIRLLTGELRLNLETELLAGIFQLPAGSPPGDPADVAPRGTPG